MHTCPKCEKSQIVRFLKVIMDTMSRSPNHSVSFLLLRMVGKLLVGLNNSRVILPRDLLVTFCSEVSHAAVQYYS